MKTLKFQITSDFHFERKEQRVDFERTPLLPSAPILIIAGDAGELLRTNRFKNQTAMKYQLDYLSKNWEKVFMIPGNHEYYGSDLNDFPKQWLTTIDTYSNLYMGNQYHMELGNQILIFATLWTKIPEKNTFYYQSHMDFKEITYDGKPLTLSVYNEYHQRDLEFIKNTCEKFPEYYKTVITHHLPDRGLITRMYRESKKNDVYASGAFSEISDLIDNWVFGHSHHKMDEKIKGCRFMSDAWGYYQENFDKSKSQTFELELSENEWI